MKKFNKFKAYISSVITLLVSSLVISFVAFTYAAYLNHETHKHTINVNFDYKAYFGEGSDVNNKIYTIYTAEHLRNLSKLVAIGTFTKEYTFILAKDINYTETESDPMMPIGSDDTPFYSTFDGRGHTISNLIVVGADTADVGMFGYVANGATIKNYFLDSPIVTARGTFEASSYSNDGFLNRSRNLLYKKFGKELVDKISLVPDSFKTGTVNGVADTKIGFKKFSFNGLDAFSQYNPQIYISKDVVDSSVSSPTSPSYTSTFTLKPSLSLSTSQYFTVEIYVEGLVNDPATNQNYYSRYTLERFKIYLKVETNDNNEIIDSYFVYNPSDVNVYKKTIETEPTYSSVGSQTTFYYNRHVVYAGIVCGHLDGNAEYIGVINGTLKADNRPIRSNSILIGKRIDDDDISNISKEHINFADSITDSIGFIEEENNGIEESNKQVKNRYIKNIYKYINNKLNNDKSTLSNDADHFFRIYGSNTDGSGVSLVKHKYTPVISDGEGNFIPETDGNNVIKKEGNFISLSKPLYCALSSDNHGGIGILNDRYEGGKNYLQENCISMWITKDSSQASALSTLFSQTGDFYLNFEFDYLFFDSNAEDTDGDGDYESSIELVIKSTSKHNEKNLPYIKPILAKTYYYYYKVDNSNSNIIEGTSYYYPQEITTNGGSNNGTLQLNPDDSDPRVFSDKVYKSKDDISEDYAVVNHKIISIASNPRYFNSDDYAKRTPIFNIGLSLPDTYPSEGVYSLDLLNFTMTLTSKSGNVIGDPLTVDFLANNTPKDNFDNQNNTFTDWPINSMVKVSTTCFSKFLAGTKGIDYNLVNGVFTYEPTANNGSYNTLIPGSGNNAFYVVSTRANNSKNNKNNVTITYYNSVSDGTNNNIPYNETGYTQANIRQGQ